MKKAKSDFRFQISVNITHYPLPTQKPSLVNDMTLTNFADILAKVWGDNRNHQRQSDRLFAIAVVSRYC